MRYCLGLVLVAVTAAIDSIPRFDTGTSIDAVQSPIVLPPSWAQIRAGHQIWCDEHLADLANQCVVDTNGVHGPIACQNWIDTLYICNQWAK